MMAFLSREEYDMFWEDGIDAGDLDGRLRHLRRERQYMLYEDDDARQLRKEQQQPSLEKERFAMRMADPLFQKACPAVSYCEASAFSKACIVRAPILDPHHVMV